MRQTLRENRALAALVLALALAWRVLLPAGTMAGFDPASRGFAVRLCDGSGVARLAPAPGIPADKAHAAESCPFAVLAMAGLDAPAMPVVAPVPMAAAFVAPLLPAELAALRPHYRRPPRAPPVLP